MVRLIHVFISQTSLKHWPNTPVQKNDESFPKIGVEINVGTQMVVDEDPTHLSKRGLYPYPSYSLHLCFKEITVLQSSWRRRLSTMWFEVTECNFWRLPWILNCQQRFCNQTPKADWIWCNCILTQTHTFLRTEHQRHLLFFLLQKQAIILIN